MTWLCKKKNKQEKTTSYENKMKMQIDFCQD